MEQYYEEPDAEQYYEKPAVEQNYEKAVGEQNYEEPVVEQCKEEPAVMQYHERYAEELYKKKHAMGDEFATYTVSTTEEGKHETDRKMKLPQQEPSVLSMCPDGSDGGDIVGVPVRTSHVVRNLPRGDR